MDVSERLHLLRLDLEFFQFGKNLGVILSLWQPQCICQFFHGIICPGLATHAALHIDLCRLFAGVKFSTKLIPAGLP